MKRADLAKGVLVGFGEPPHLAYTIVEIHGHLARLKGPKADVGWWDCSLLTQLRNPDNVDVSDLGNYTVQDDLVVSTKPRRRGLYELVVDVTASPQEIAKTTRAFEKFRDSLPDDDRHSASFLFEAGCVGRMNSTAQYYKRFQEAWNA